MPMGLEASGSPDNNERWDGAALAGFFERSGTGKR
jgi:hypothetical protein